MRTSRIMHFAVASALVSGGMVGLLPATAQAATVPASLVKTTNTAALG